MAEIVKLTPGTQSQSPTAAEQAERIATLKATVEHYLPDLVQQLHQVEAAPGSGEKRLLLHQDAFAGGYDKDEYTLLGMVIKYAGLSGITVTIHGTNQETF